MPVSLTPLLSLFSPDQIGQLSRYGESVLFEKGAKVVSQGQENDFLYLVLSGGLSVLSSDGSSEIELATISTGQTIGEMSLFDPSTASACVKAEEDTETWRISRAGLDLFRDEHPDQAYELLGQICKVLSHRLRSTSRELANSRI